MMTPMPAVPDETTKAFTYSTPAVEAPTSASPLDKWRDLSDRVQGMAMDPFQYWLVILTTLAKKTLSIFRGLGYIAISRLRENCSQVEVEVISKSMNKINEI